MRLPLIVALMAWTVGAAPAAPVPWADPALPATQGLAVWFDASRLNAGRGADHLPALAEGAAVDGWPDASGNQRDLAQQNAESRPEFRLISGIPVVRFDGKDDFLSATGLRGSMRDATVFFVAAPRTNAGGYRCFLSANATGGNDYTTGLNLDMGRSKSGEAAALNVEGAGFPGERALLASAPALESFHVVAVQVGTGEAGAEVRVYLDGAEQGKRDRKAEPLRFDQITLGARYCSNDPAKAPFVQGFLEGDIAEVLVYDRALSGDERGKVADYLAKKHAPLMQRQTGTQGPRKPLVPATDVPMVQMLVPGFAARELPVKLTNIDCLRYRPDGRLLAGAYNGKIWLLSDSDGDGLEDKAELYWQSDDLKNVIGMALTPPGDPRGDGVFVATAGRILFIRDKDRDGRGDEQVVVASGWEKQAAPGGGGSVDAVGVVVAPDGSIYFGLGTSAYNNAYLLDGDGKAHYRLESERGTILRIAPDFSKREIVCTGIRYPIGAAFNRLGDLFVTEQEGATWLANGNPFDELLHIVPGRHYGFPPRHPRHLPNVIDEPSTFDYSPQHQSTCGFTFNESVNGGPAFGPPTWAGDAIVTGEARGKLWRTKLVKTTEGYVAKTQLFACLSMLATDVALSPRGDLIVCGQSGKPDWGTGPEGFGHIVQIGRAPAPAVQPVLAWSSGPGEFRVAFDGPLDTARLRDVAKSIDITRGRYVSAGDRFEMLRPGYQAVKDQMAAPRYDVPVLGAAFSPDARTLIIATPPQRAATPYALTLPITGSASPIDLATDLCGVEARWTSVDGKRTQTVTLPHADLQVAKALTAGSAEHDAFWENLKQPGTLSLRGWLDLWQMLHPAVQPGAKLDYEPEVEKVTVKITGGREDRTLGAQARDGKWQNLEADFTTGGSEPKIHITWSTADDPRPRPVPVRRFLVPWARPEAELAMPVERSLPELAGGNWLRGRRLYFGKANCHTCHAVSGEGGHVGPDLSNLVQRDLGSVLRDIREPSAALNPDHIAYQITGRDGSEQVAVILAQDPARLKVADATGAVHEIARSEVLRLAPLSVSLMPPGLLDALSAGEQKDLLTFLLLPGLDPAPVLASDPPAGRPRTEVLKVLAQIEPPAAAAKPLRVLISSGPKDHGPGEHDYPLFAERWSHLLALAERVEVKTQVGWPTAAQFSNSDVIIFYSNNPGWTAQRQPELDDFVHRGGGAVFIHWAIEGHDAVGALAESIGLASKSGESKFRHGPLELRLTDREHPITRGLDDLKLTDESYWALVGDPKQVHLLATQNEENEARPQVWSTERGSGRIFVCIPGHYTWTFDDPLYRLLLLRGICWAGKEPVDRLSELSTVGARIGEGPAAVATAALAPPEK